MTRPLGKVCEEVCLIGLSRKAETIVRVAVLLAACLTPILAFAQSDLWLGGTGNWSNASKWSAGVPTASSTVFIDNGKAGASPVALDINGSAANLTIDSDDSLSFNNGFSLSFGSSSGGTINNAGHLNINSTGAATGLQVNLAIGGAMLTGGGMLTMSNNPNNVIGVLGGGLTNINNTIQGAGQIGNTQMGLNNQSTINAKIGGSGANPLIVDPAGTAGNTGTMEATNGGTLELQQSFNNTGGKIQAVGTGSMVLLGPNTSFDGGTLTTSAGGIVGVTNNTNSEHAATLEGFTDIVTNAGTFEVFDGATLVLDGTINNTGTILMNGLNNSTLLDVSGPNHAATLTGKGTVTMSNSVNNVIGVFGGNLTNLNNTIQGAGQIGNTQAGLNNKGKIIANQPTTLIIDCAGFSNSGTLMVNKGSLMNINQVFSNFSGTTLTGGTYSVSGTLQFNGANIVNDAAHITLTGTASAIVDQAANDGLRNLVAITKKGSLALHSGKILTTPADLSNAGRLTVGAGTNLKVTGGYPQAAGTT